MNGTSGFQEVLSSTSQSPSRIGSCTSNGINSDHVPGTFSILTISSLSPQASARSGNRFLTPLSLPRNRFPAALCTKTLPRMAPQVRMINRFFSSSYDHIALCAGIRTKREKVSVS